MSLSASNELSPPLRERVLERLGFSAAPAADLEGVRALYRAWCERVPFDNVGKVIALRTAPAGVPLHGIFAAAFFETWLESGIGATCWPSSNALHALLAALEFRARRVAGHMRDVGVLNHGTVVVNVEDNAWLVDSSLLTMCPLPMNRGVFMTHDPIFPSEIEFDSGAHVVWTTWPSSPDSMPCRVFPDALEHEEFLARYEATRERSPFNGRLYACRHRRGAFLVLEGNVRYARTGTGTERQILSRAELLDSMRGEFDMAGSILDRWAAAGGLDAAFEEHSGPVFPPETRKPPSRR